MNISAPTQIASEITLKEKLDFINSEAFEIKGIVGAIKAATIGYGNEDCANDCGITSQDTIEWRIDQLNNTLGEIKACVRVLIGRIGE